MIFKGTLQQINQDFQDIGYTEAQSCCVIGCFFITVIFLLAFIKEVAKHYINKSCIGCKRLAKVECKTKTLNKDIIKIRKKIEIINKNKL